MSEWISVKERLPPTGVRVLAWVRDCHGKSEPSVLAYTVPYTSKHFTPPAFWDGDGPMSWTEDDVTHWMPLPDPPAIAPKPLTKTEALREAMKILHLFVNRECGGTQWTQEEIVTGCGQLPRLRAALESED